MLGIHGKVQRISLEDERKMRGREEGRKECWFNRTEDQMEM